MRRNIIVQVIVTFVTIMLLSFVIHGLVLGDEYLALDEMFRPIEEQQQYVGFTILAHALIAIGLVWIYRMGREDKGSVGQGLRFSLAVALVMVPSYLVYYAVLPYPGVLVGRQMTYDFIQLLIVGQVIAWLNR